MIYLGIDNGVSGSIGLLNSEGKSYFHPQFIKKTLNYQKTKDKYINRIDWHMWDLFLEKLFREGIGSAGGILKCENRYNDIKCIIEAPMVNPNKWTASVSALRAYEAMIMILERWSIGTKTETVGTWRKKILPGYIRDWGAAKCKDVGLEIAKREYPVFSEVFEKTWRSRRFIDRTIQRTKHSIMKTPSCPKHGKRYMKFEGFGRNKTWYCIAPTPEDPNFNICMYHPNLIKKGRAIHKKK